MDRQYRVQKKHKRTNKTLHIKLKIGVTQPPPTHKIKTTQGVNPCAPEVNSSFVSGVNLTIKQSRPLRP